MTIEEVDAAATMALNYLRSAEDREMSRMARAELAMVRELLYEVQYWAEQYDDRERERELR